MPSKRKIKRRQQTDEEVERNRRISEHPQLCNCPDCMPESVEKQFEQPICKECQQVNCQCRAVLMKENKPERPNKERIYMTQQEPHPNDCGCLKCIPEQPNTELKVKAVE